MKIRLLIQILCCLVFSVMSSTAFATWYTANGTGSDRNDAVNDAIRNVMLQVGADVKIEQNYKNGVLQSDNVNIMSRSPIKKLVVMSEQTTFSKVTVTIKAFIDERFAKARCSGAAVHKAVLPVSFRFADSQAYQGSIGIEGISKELDKLVMENLYNTSSFVTRPLVRANLNTSNSPNMSNAFQVSNLSSLADRYGSQYIILGTINSVSTSEVGNNVLTKLMYVPTRTINFDIDVYDAINEQIIFHRNYTAEADWPFKQSEYIDLRSDRFKSSEYGQRVYGLAAEVSKDLVAELQCKPANAKIIDLDGDDVVINVGRENGISPNMKFTLVQAASMSGPNGDNYSAYEKSNSVYKVVSVYPHAAKLHPVDLQNNTLNVNVNDVVTLQ